MGKDKFNPYDYSQYHNLPKPPPAERTLTPRGGMSFEQLESYRHIMQNYDKALQRTLIWNERSGDRYPTLRRGWEDADNIEGRLGQKLCRDQVDFDKFNP